MPSLSFVLPHWLYWSGLLFFPLIAWYLAARQQRNPPNDRPKLFIAYVFWLLAGYLGIHRFYVRSRWGFVFIPVFVAMMWFNGQVSEVRDDVSRTRAAAEAAHTALEQMPAPATGEAPELAQRRTKAQGELDASNKEAAEALAVSDHWYRLTRYTSWLLALMLLVDAFLLPGLVRRRAALEDAHPELRPRAGAPLVEVAEGGVGQAPSLHVRTRFTDAIDRFNALIGEYVAWWALIAVFVYYYEVLARYVFTSPTNWVHESMFLMFGMQYMLCGAYAYREDQHVRVDIFYAKFSTRGKAIADIVTSVFFFIFMITMLVTGIRFAMDSVGMGEHSFTEWGVQYWPVKIMIPLGALLMTLQGLSKLIKDFAIVARREA